MFKRYKYVEGLTSLVGSKNKYLINILGQVKDTLGNDVLTQLDEDGYKTVSVSGWGGERSYRVVDLMVIQFKYHSLPESLFDKIIGFVIDGDKDNLHANNIGYRFKDGKLEVPNKPGYFFIPNFPKVAINISGELLNIRLNTIFKWYITPPQLNKNIKGGYYNTSIVLGYKRNVGISRHRLLSLVFKKYPDNCDNLVVNHIDGIPGNDYLDNLEWVTRSANNFHAYQNDLKNQHKRILTRDVLTGEVIEYYSISECARVLEYSHDETIRSRVIDSESFGKVWIDGKQFKLKDDKRDWIIPEDPEKAIKEAQFKVPIKVRNCFTLEETEYESISDAGEATGANGATINFRLAKDDLRPLRGYQFMHVEDERDWVKFTAAEVEETLLPVNIQVDARNHFTGEQLSFPSVRQAVKHIGNAHNAAELRSGTQPLLNSGWQLKYSTDEWVEIENPEKQIQANIREIMARNEETGEILITVSSRKMAEFLGRDPKMIKRVALTCGNQIYHGYRFRLGFSNDPWPTTYSA